MALLNTNRRLFTDKTLTAPSDLHTSQNLDGNSLFYWNDPTDLAISYKLNIKSGNDNAVKYDVCGNSLVFNGSLLPILDQASNNLKAIKIIDSGTNYAKPSVIPSIIASGVAPTIKAIVKDGSVEKTKWSIIDIVNFSTTSITFIIRSLSSKLSNSILNKGKLYVELNDEKLSTGIMQELLPLNILDTVTYNITVELTNANTYTSLEDIKHSLLNKHMLIHSGAYIINKGGDLFKLPNLVYDIYPDNTRYSINLSPGTYSWSVASVFDKEEKNCTEWSEEQILIVPISKAFDVVNIGLQSWTSKNFNLETYRDGTPIPQVTDPGVWQSLTTGAWCWYNNSSTNEISYGKLYNWYAVAGIWDEASKTDLSKRKKLAPAGYHVPSKDEWLTLSACLGGPLVAGGKMRTTVGWEVSSNYELMEINNSSGFSGRPGGYRYGYEWNDDFGVPGEFGYWWSSSDIDIANAWSHYINYFDTSFQSTINDKSYGFSVRLIKD